MAVKKKISRVRGGRIKRMLAVVRFFVIGFPRNPIIFDPGVNPYTIGMDVRLDVIELQIKTDIAVKFAVRVIAGIPFNRRPDLF